MKWEFSFVVFSTLCNEQNTSHFMYHPKEEVLLLDGDIKMEMVLAKAEIRTIRNNNKSKNMK